MACIFKMIGVARSSAKLSGAWVLERDPFNFRKPHKGYTLRRPIRSAQEIRPRKVEKVKKEKEKWRKCGGGTARNTHTDARLSCAGETIAERRRTVNEEDNEGIKNTAVARKKKQKGAKGEGNNGKRIPKVYSARTLTHACARPEGWKVRMWV